MSNRFAKKPDRITNPQEIGVISKMAKYYALEPLDEIASEMEMKWGVGRLPRLVTPETSSKFGSAMAKLDKAIDADDNHLDVVKKAALMIRAWKALDKEAESMDAKPIDPAPLASWRTDGIAHCLFKSPEDAYHYARSEDGEGVHTHSLDEMTRCVDIVESKFAVLGEAKTVFPGASLSAVNTNGKMESDSIPF